jgi:thioredoxin 2
MTPLSSARHIVCAHCAAVNRVPAEKSAVAAKCGKCHRPLFSGHPLAATAANFTKQIQSNDIPVVVDFWAEWCGPCKAFAPTFERVAAELEPDVRFLKVDTDREQSLAAQFGIRSIPTLMLFKNGHVTAQHSGAMNAQMLRAWLARNA